jgi:hypothetical protein
MTAGPWTMTNAFRTHLVDGDLGNLSASNAIRVALFTSSSNLGASSTTYSAITNEVSNANGYTTGGVTNITLTAAGTTSVTLTPTTNVVWTASGSGIAAYFAAAYLYAGGTTANQFILAYCLLDNTPATVTVSSGNTLTISDSNPILTVA